MSLVCELAKTQITKYLSRLLSELSLEPILGPADPPVVVRPLTWPTLAGSLLLSN